MSRPFVERLIGTVRREYLDRTFFWNRMDVEQKLEQLKTYYHEFRVYQSFNGTTPAQKGGGSTVAAVSLEHYGWRNHCHGLFQLPIAA